MNVLIITTREEALHHGANPATAHHRSSPEVQFWWPTLGTDCLQGRHFDMVIRDTALWLPGQIVTWLRAHCCYRNETLFVEAKELGGAVLLESTVRV